MSDIKKIKDEYLDKLRGDLNLENVNKIKTELFGKNGAISNLFKKLGSMPSEDRKILAEIAYDNPEAFKTIVKKAQAALN